MSNDQDVPHCQNGRGDICLAGRQDGVVCPEDECDIDTGVREAQKLGDDNLRA
jgi:hypothetical protein